MDCVRTAENRATAVIATFGHRKEERLPAALTDPVNLLEAGFRISFRLADFTWSISTLRLERLVSGPRKQ